MSQNYLINNAIQNAVGNSYKGIGAKLIVQSSEKNVGYYFDIVEEHSLSIQNQITDNFLENNTAVQDHIAHNPITVSLNGLSGEIIFEQPNWILNQTAQGYNNVPTDKLQILPALIPQVDNVTQIAKNTIQYVESSYKRYEKIIKRFTNQSVKTTRLKQIYRDLKGLSDSNIALFVVTPYATFENMYIQSITLRQGNENYITDVGVTLKQVQYANVGVTEADQNVLAKYNEFARAKVENNGKAKSIQTNDSLLYSWFGNNAPYKTR